MKVKKLYSKGKSKALTLSYDDGICQDIKLVEILNRYGLKATFNLNSGLQDESNRWTDCGVEVKRMNKDVVVNLYNGHEVACHAVHHPHLEELSDEEIGWQVGEDRTAHQLLFGEEVRGMAYPFGTFDSRVKDIVSRCGIVYARTVRETEAFGLPEDFLEWDATCHHNNPRLMALGEKFLASNEELALFYLWGHSYEFDVNNNWEIIEDFSKLVSGKEDVWYATNLQIYDYLKAMEQLVIDSSAIKNPSNLSLWLDIDGEIIEVRAGQTVEFI